MFYRPFIANKALPLLPASSW